MEDLSGMGQWPQEVKARQIWPGRATWGTPSTGRRRCRWGGRVGVSGWSWWCTPSRTEHPAAVASSCTQSVGWSWHTRSLNPASGTLQSAETLQSVTCVSKAAHFTLQLVMLAYTITEPSPWNSAISWNIATVHLQSETACFTLHLVKSTCTSETYYSNFLQVMFTYTVRKQNVWNQLKHPNHPSTHEKQHTATGYMHTTSKTAHTHYNNLLQVVFTAENKMFQISWSIPITYRNRWCAHSH